jgi:hypothetical protein
MRNAELRVALEALWEQDYVDMRKCQGCGFGFANPFVAGNADIYNLIGNGSQHYPRDRFEFTQTLKALERRGGVDSLLEIGAGSGAFIRQVQAAGLAKSLTATEYDDSGVSRLSRIVGTTVFQGDVQTLADQQPRKHDAICLFQVLEHLDRLDQVFEALQALTSSHADVFVGVPNSSRTVEQERLTGYLDMPPVHIGRWTDGAITLLAERNGFAFVESRLNPSAPIKELWGLAKYRLESRTHSEHNAASRVEAISFRPARGAAKRLLAVWDLMSLLPAYGTIPPDTRWIHLSRVS